MGQLYNIYCDESCHLENDCQKAMVIGGVWCSAEKTKAIAKRLKEIKRQHGLSSDFEIKWTKVSPAKLDFYLHVTDYFFDDDDLHSRFIVIPDKSVLDHKKFMQSHNQWYYKMYFDMLKTILSPSESYRIYIDIKDTKGGCKVRKLQDVLSNSLYDFNRKVIEWIQLVRSHDVELMQLADFLIGSVSYINRGLSSSEAKQTIVQRIRERSGYSLTRSTLYRENKFNIFIWKASQKED